MSRSGHDRYLTLGTTPARAVTVRERARRVLRSGVLGAASILKRSPKRFLRPFYGHYVFDDERDGFERIVLALRNEGEFVDTPTCVEMLAGRREIDGRYFHLSFDDGYRNVFTNAIPVLARHRIPAIFFVTSTLVDGDWETSSRAVPRIWRARGMAPFPGVMELVRWTDLREMIAAGFEVGSHTRTHRCVVDLDGEPGALAAEIAGSKHELETALGVPCAYLSWPYGAPSDVDAVALETARRAGYHAAFSAVRGSAPRAGADLFFIPRHHFEPRDPLAHIRYFARGGREPKP